MAFYFGDNNVNVKSLFAGEDDLMIGFGAGDELVGGGGVDLVIGGKGDDLVIGGADGDIVRGGFDNDIIRGGDGNDLLLGEFGDNRLLGGNGDDFIVAGEGFNFMKGGSGADQFVLADHFGAGHGTGIIADFTVGEDLIRFCSSSVTKFEDLTITYDFAGNAILSDGGSLSVKVKGLTEADVLANGADLFVF